jgi:hypothetical protein
MMLIRLMLLMLLLLMMMVMMVNHLSVAKTLVMAHAHIDSTATDT